MRHGHERALGDVAVLHAGRVLRGGAARDVADAVAGVARAVHELDDGLHVDAWRFGAALDDADAGLQHEPVR